MKRSSQVAAPLLASAALAFLAGCRKPEMQRCVDEHNVVVDESLCKGQPLTQQHTLGNGGYFPYRWYYGGFGGYGLGTPVGGGAYAPLAGHSYASPTSRGGFGSTFSGGGEGGASE